MSKKIGVTIIGTIMSFLFTVMFWLQLGTIATAVARTKTETGYAVTSNPYLPLQSLKPVY
jgi:hypothetical protein